MTTRERHDGDAVLPSSIVYHRLPVPSSNASAFASLLTTTGPGRAPGPAAWCPTMDLLALSSADGRLAVRRLDWTRLWSARVGAANASSSASAATATTGAAVAKPFAAAPSTSSSSSPSTSITALAWRPDGRALAVASHCGGLEVRAAEDGEVLASLAGGGTAAATAAASFVALSWATDGDDGGGDDEKGGRRRPAAAALSLRHSLLASGPPLPPCPLPSPAEFEEKREAEAEEEAEVAEGAAEEGTTGTTTTPTTQRAPPQRHEPVSLQVLAAADNAGVVHLFGPGLIPLARLPVAEAVKKRMRNNGKGDESVVVAIRAVALSTGLDSLHVLLAFHYNTSPSRSEDDDKTESLLLATVDTRALSKGRRELTRVLHAAGHALSLLSVASRSAEAAAAHWREAECIVEREVLSKLEKLQADFGEGEGDAATKMENEEGGGGRIGLGGAIGGSGGGGGSNKENASSPSSSPSGHSGARACLSRAALCGAVSAPLAHFWESDPGARGLRAAARSSDTACRSASEIVRATTEPALEAACYFVGEIQRVAESSSSSSSKGEGEGASGGRWGGALGLRKPEAAEAARRARDAAAAAAAARAAVAEGVASSRSLFLWLMASAARVTTTTAAAAGAQGEDGGEEEGVDDGGDRAAAAARAAARAISAVLPRGDPLAATAALSRSVAVNPRLAAAVALGKGGGGGGNSAGGKAAAARGRDRREIDEALSVASCDPLSHPGVPSAVLDALGRRSWPPPGRGTMRSLSLAAARAVEGMLDAVCERLSERMRPGVEGAAGAAAALGRAEKGGQVRLVAAGGKSDGAATIRAAAAFIAPGGSAAVAARAVSSSSSRGVAALSVEAAAVAPVVAIVGREGGGESAPLPAPRVVGLGLYRGNALVILSDDNGKSGATLALVTADELSFSSSSSVFSSSSDNDDGNEKSVSARWRLVSSSSDASAAAPLAVSASRGVACALTEGGTRATVFDLEEDDEEEEEDEGGDEGGYTGGAKSSDDDEGGGNGRHHHDSDSDDTSSLSDGSGDGGGGMSSE